MPRRRLILILSGALALFFAVFGLLLIAPRLNPPYEGVATRVTDQGTSYHFRAYGVDAQNALDAAARRVQAIDNTIEGNPGADIERMNEHAGEYIQVDPATLYLLHEGGVVLREKLLGALSVCDLRIRTAYGMEETPAKLDALQTIWDEDPGMDGLGIIYADVRAGIPIETGITLKSILPGYAADQSASIVRDYRVDSAYLQIGSSVAIAIGERPDGGFWTYQVPHPLQEGSVLGSLILKDQAVATVGLYQGSVEIDGCTYPLLIDPITRRPPETGFTSVTVTAPTALEAAGLAQALMCLPPEQGLALLNSFEGGQAIYTMADGSVYWTRGLDDSFSLRALEFTRAEQAVARPPEPGEAE